MNEYRIIIKDIQDGRQYQNWIKANNEREAINLALDLATDNLDTDLSGLEVLSIEDITNQ